MGADAKRQNHVYLFSISAKKALDRSGKSPSFSSIVSASEDPPPLIAEDLLEDRYHSTI
jgi:hypothetical protein